jgi:NAD(P)-dependent dehydrogenase (short-subunit alcohol dehydrogenase family)
MQIKNSVFVITGGCSGLGEATVRRLHAAGARVLAVDVATHAGERLAAQLGERAHFQRTDVTSELDVQSAIQCVTDRFGRIDGLVNCAGVAPAERVVGRHGAHRLETFARCIQINLIGTFNMIRLVAAAMATQTPGADAERGVIINTASIAAYEGQIGQSAYAASKAGIVGMTLPIARELAHSAIRVVTIAPGLMQTPMLDGLSVEVQAALRSSTVFPPRLGRPEEFAALVQHIFENPLLNGATIRLDGAVRLAAN